MIETITIQCCPADWHCIVVLNHIAGWLGLIGALASILDEHLMRYLADAARCGEAAAVLPSRRSISPDSEPLPFTKKEKNCLT